jgi:hypothetical protein
MASRDITIGDRTITINSVHLDFANNEWGGRVTMTDPTFGFVSDRTVTFDVAEITAALTALGSRTITNAGDLDDYLKDIHQKLIETKFG